MPLLITCPDCDRQLRVPDDLLGKKVRCPSCSVMFQAVAAGAEEPLEEARATAARGRSAARDERFADEPRSGRRPALRDEDEEYDRPRRRRRYDEDDDDRGPSVADQKSGWGKVRIGITLVMLGTWANIFGVFMGCIGLLLGIVLLGGAFTAGSLDGGFAQGGAGVIVMVLGAIIYAALNFAEFVLRLIGFGLCIAVPPRRDTGLKPLAITSFALAGGHALFSVLNVVLGGFSTNLLQRSGGALSSGASLLALLLNIAAFIVFMCFLRSVTRAVRARDLSGRPIMAIIAFACYYVVGGLIGSVLIVAAFGSAFMAMKSETTSGAATTMGAMAIIAIVVLSLLVLVYLGLQVWYVMVLQKIRDAVGAYRPK